MGLESKNYSYKDIRYSSHPHSIRSGDMTWDPSHDTDQDSHKTKQTKS